MICSSGHVDAMKDPYGAATGSCDNVRRSTGLVYDPAMAEHFNPWDPEHVEKPARLLDSYARCNELGLVERCRLVPTRKATDEVTTLNFLN